MTRVYIQGMKVKLKSRP